MIVDNTYVDHLESWRGSETRANAVTCAMDPRRSDGSERTFPSENARFSAAPRCAPNGGYIVIMPRVHGVITFVLRLTMP